MKSNETNFVIDLEGRVYRQDVNYRELDPGEAMQKAFTTNVVTRIRNILELPGHGLCHVVVEAATGIQYWSVPMKELVLRTTFAPNDAGEFYPTFAPKDSAEVIMEIVWNLELALAEQDHSMAIRFVAEVGPSGSGFYVRDHYLYAFSPTRAAFKLPLGNLYENCRLCMGDYSSITSTAAGSVILALKQFRAAPWNSDLFNDEDVVSRFFRFKPLDKGFLTLPIQQDWTRDCCKVATSNLKFVEI